MWTNKEKEFLADNYNVLTTIDIANALGKSADAVNYMIGRLGLSTPKNIWTDQDILYLESNIGKMSYAEIASYLGRSVRSVGNKACNIRMASVIETNFSEIETGVAMRPSKAAIYRAMLSHLEIGQSFIFPHKEKALLGLQRTLFKDKLFRAQKIDEHSMRLWRLA